MPEGVAGVRGVGVAGVVIRVHRRRHLSLSGLPCDMVKGDQIRMVSLTLNLFLFLRPSLPPRSSRASPRARRKTPPPVQPLWYRTP